MSNINHLDHASPDTRPGKSFTRFLPPIARILMGLVFFVIGLNKFLNFIPPPKTPLPAGAQDFFIAMMKTGYLIPLLASTEMLTGALLLVNRFVPFALVLIAPVIVNIMAFNIFLAPSGIIMGLIVLVLEIFLVWCYRHCYRSLFAVRAAPSVG